MTRVLEKASFEREGHVRQNVFFRRDSDGRPRWQDTLEYGLVQPRDRRRRRPGLTLSCFAMEPSPGVRVVLEVDAVVFDCDGVLVDSAASVERSWRRWAGQYGLDADAVIAVAPGRPSRDTAAAWVPPDRLDEASARIDAIEIEDAAGTESIPGALELLASLPVDRWAIVTSAGRELLRARIEAAGLPLPAVVVTSDDVVRGKPDPEGYALALRRLGVRRDRAVVLEDTLSGMAAARDAGVGSIVRVGAGAPIAGESAVVADLRQVTWDGRLVLHGAGAPAPPTT